MLHDFIPLNNARKQKVIRTSVTLKDRPICSEREKRKQLNQSCVVFFFDSTPLSHILSSDPFGFGIGRQAVAEPLQLIGPRPVAAGLPRPAVVRPPPMRYGVTQERTADGRWEEVRPGPRSPIVRPSPRPPTGRFRCADVRLRDNPELEVRTENANEPDRRDAETQCNEVEIRWGVGRGTVLKKREFY